MTRPALRFLRSPHEIVGRAGQQLSILRERMVGPRRLRSDHESLRNMVHDLASGSLGRLGPGLDAIDNTVSTVRRSLTRHVSDTIDAANAICSGQVRIMGHGWVDVGVPPDWHREPLAGVRAPRVHWSRVPFLDTDLVGDHKVVWEFNRHQHFVTLSQAFRCTDDVRYLETLRRQFDHWISENPPMIGINWASSLEVAYRSISWLVTLRILGADSEGHSRLGDALAGRIGTLLVHHGRHIENYLSTWFSPNTHLTGEALALYYLGTALPALAESSRWQALGRSILEREIERQVRPDGVYFEQATQYHRYTAEIHLHAAMLAEANGCQLGEVHRSRLNGLFDALLALSRGDGSIPMLGDDDGGKLVQWDSNSPAQVDGLLACAAVVLDRSDLAFAGRRDNVSLTWMFGARAAAARDALAARPTRIHETFRESGLHCLRDSWDDHAGHLVFSCGPHGALSGGHAHADALSVEFWSDGGVLVDRGTYSYGNTRRDEFRVTAAHNTVEVAGQSAALPSGPFRWRSKVNGKSRGLFALGDDVSVVAAQHDGYPLPHGGVRHRRTVAHAGAGLWIISDAVDLTDGAPALLRWHLAPGQHVRCSQLGPGAWVLRLERPGKPTLAMVLLADAATLEIIDDGVSPQYGKLCASQTVQLHLSGARVAACQTFVCDWANLGVEGVEVRRSGQLLGVVTAGGNNSGARLEVGSGSYHAGAWRLAAGAYCRTGDGRLLALHVRHARRGDECVLDFPAATGLLYSRAHDVSPTVTSGDLFPVEI